MKVYLLNYQRITDGRSNSAMLDLIFRTALKLPKNFIFYTSSIDDSYSENIKGLPKIILLLQKIITKVSFMLGVPMHIYRTILESLCDLYYSVILLFDKNEYVVVTSMYTPISSMVAKKKKNKIYLIAGNQYDNLYYEVIKDEKKKYGIRTIDVYDSSFRNSFYNRMMKYIDGVVAFSKLASDSFPDGKEKFVFDTIMYHWNNFDKIKTKSTLVNDKEIKIGYIGHTTLLKGVHLLAEAIKQSMYTVQIKLIIAGNVDKSVKQLIDLQNISVIYLGNVKIEDRQRFFNQIDVLVVPSLYDAGPTTAFEAIECGLPLLISSGCGATEWINNDKMSFIFETRNVVDLRNKMNFIIDNYSIACNMAENMRNMFFDYLHQSQRIDELKDWFMNMVK